MELTAGRYPARAHFGLRGMSSGIGKPFATVRRPQPSPGKVADDQDPGRGSDHQRNRAKRPKISKPAERSREQRADRRRPQNTDRADRRDRRRGHDPGYKFLTHCCLHSENSWPYRLVTSEGYPI